MRSDPVLAQYKQAFGASLEMPLQSEEERVLFLRNYLCLVNEFFFERRKAEQIDDLNHPDPDHPEWRRLTPFLAIWDDYAEIVLGYRFDQQQIDKLASVIVDVFTASGRPYSGPRLLDADEESADLGGLTPRQFALIRLMHALQDFSRVMPKIDESLVRQVRQHFGGSIPTESELGDEEAARHLLNAFGGADSNVEERQRYIFSSARILAGLHQGGAYRIASACNNDAKKIFQILTKFPGLKTKKANMLLRDFYELGIWHYTSNLDAINIIPDRRVMRVALRTAIMRPAMGKTLNSLLDQFDFQYGLTAATTEEAFRRVWEATRQYNDGEQVVPYPAGLDEFIFKLGGGRGGCCKPNALACLTGRKPKSFTKWLQDTFSFEAETACPFESVCPEETKEMQAPQAIQNNTWMGIFTGKGGGGGLGGV